MPLNYNYVKLKQKGEIIMPINYEDDVNKIFENYDQGYDTTNGPYKKITEDAMLPCIINYFETQGRDAVKETCMPEFAKAYFLKAKTRTKFIDINIPSVKIPLENGIPENILNKFTFRHYTSNGTIIPKPDYAEIKPDYAEIKSNMTLAIKVKKDPHTSGHTTGLDWSGIGNVADTFYALCYDGNPIDTPNFIKNAKYYMEFTVAEIGNIWVSPDWLQYAAKTGTSIPYPENMTYEGSAEAVLNALFPLIKFHKQDDTYIKTRIKELAGSKNFEVKAHGSRPIPTTPPTPSPEWKAVTKV
jgi:hypothetical protein